MLAFFAVGFLAGSFERAAGLGDLTSDRHPTPYASAVAPPIVPPKPVLVERRAAPIVPPRPVLVERPASPLVPPRPVLVERRVSLARASPELPSPVESSPPLAERAFVRPMQGDPGDADGDDVEVVDDLAPVQRDLRLLALAPRKPMSVPSVAEQSPIPAIPLVSLPLGDNTLIAGLPASHIVWGLRPEREPMVAAAPEYILPIKWGRVTSMFNQGRRHPAIDLAAPLGTPVLATTRKQRVTFAGRRGGYGNLVVTRDPQGREHYYGHLQRIVARIGSLLEQGDLLGLLGSTGFSTGPHVHYEVRVRGRHLDPAGLLFAGRRVSRGYAWNHETSDPTVATRVAERPGQPRPR